MTSVRPVRPVRPVRSGGRALAAALLVATVLLTGAAPAAAETVVAVDAGYDGRFVAGQPVPVRVRVTADRLLATTLEVGLEGEVPLTVAVEVPGGSEKQFVVVVPTTPFQPVATVAARLGGGPSGQTTLRGVQDEELVGLLPGAAGGGSLPGPAPLAVDVGTARFVALGEEELNHAPTSLAPLGTVAATADDLARLAPGARDGLLRWIEGGGHLLVGSEPGDAVPGLPDAWQPATSARAMAGEGEVRAVGDALAEGRWTGLVEPTAKGSAAEQGAPASAGEMAFSLANEAGLQVAELSWLMAFLVGYVVVVGPVVYVVVRRRRRPELAWVAIPVVAVLFTTGAYVGGQGLRATTQVVHASVLDTGATGSSLLTYLGVTSRSGETVDVAFPEGWLPVPDANEGRIAGSGAVSRFAVAPDGLVASIPLDAGQFGVLAGTGPVAASGRLEVTGARVGDGGNVEGTVRNGTPHALDAIGVLSGRTVASVGALAPGEEGDFTLVAVGDGPPVEWRLWGNDFGRPASDGAVDPTLWSVTASADPDLLAPGRIVAAGWTRDLEPPVGTSGRSSRPEGRTLVLGRGTVPGGAEAAAAEVVRGGFSRFAGPSATSTVRLTLPPGSPPEEVRLRSPVPTASVWVDGAWSPLSCGPGCDRADIGHSREAIVNGFGGPEAPFPRGLPAPTTVPAAPVAPVAPAPPVTNLARPLPVPAPVPECPPGADCGFGWAGVGGQAFLIPVPADAFEDGVLFVQVDHYYPAGQFGLAPA